MIVLQIFSIIIWLLLIPYAMGLLPARLLADRYRTPGVVLLTGYIFMFAVFELIAIPIVFTTVYHGLTTLMNWFTVVSLIIAGAGIVCEVLSFRKGGKLTGWGEPKKISTEEKIVWVIFILIVGFQLCMALSRAFFDGDDAYYVVQSLIAQQKDSLYRIEPDTGKSTPLDMRHAMAVFPLWIAHVAGRSGIHATIVSHSIIPLVLLPLTYLLHFQIGKSLLKKKQDMLPMFMVIMALLQMFGNVSIYTNETFLMMRTWQGKSFAGNFIIPAVLWLFLWIFEEEKEERQKNAILWILLAAVNWMAGIGSSQAVFLCAILTCIFGFYMMIKEKSIWVMVKAGLTCIPNAVYILLYLLFTH